MGGIEFYDKAMKRASLIRKLHSKGGNFFDEDDDELPLTFKIHSDSQVKNRKAFCEKALERLIKDEKSPQSFIGTLLEYEYT